MLFSLNNKLFIPAEYETKLKQFIKVDIEKITQEVYTDSLLTKNYIQTSANH